MAYVLNNSTGEEEEVPDEQVASLVASGKAVLPDGRITVRAPDGSLGTIDASTAAKSFGDGFKFIGDTELREIKDEAKYGDRPIAAGLAGVGRGATLGLSDLVLTETGAVAPKTLRELEERNEAASLGGEAVGVAGSLLIPGAGEITTAKYAAKAGQLAGKAVLKAGAQTAAKKILATGTAAAVEGSFFGAGHALSESVLGETDLTAEKLAAGAGIGALVGGAGGLALGTVGEGISRGFKALNSKAVGKMAEADARGVVRAAEEDAATIASAKGQLGAETQKASRQLENLQRAAQGLDGPEGEAARAFLKSEAGQELQAGVARNALREAPTQLTTVEEKRIALNSLLENSESNILRRASEITSPREAWNQVKARAARYVAPFTGRLAGGGAGMVVGGPVGGAVAAFGGDVVGSLAGGQLRPSLQAIKRMADHPAVVKGFWKAIKSATSKAPDVFGPYAQILEGAAARGAPELWSAHTALAENDSGYRETLAKAGFPEETPDDIPRIESRSTKLAALMDAVNSHDKRVDASIDRFLGRQAGAPPAPKPPEASRDARLSSYRDRFDTVSNLMANPGALADALSPGTVLVDAAPNVAGATAATVTRALRFLADTAPTNPNPQLIGALERPWSPSDTQLYKWGKYVDAIDNPGHVLNELKRGTVTQESIQALSAVYPRLLQDIRERMMARVSEYDGSLNPRQRAALSTLLGKPIDSGSVTTQQVLQQMHAENKQAEAKKQSARTSAPSANTSKIAGSYESQSQRIEGRGQA